MTDEENTPEDPCEHMCSFGCGNTYQFVVVTIEDSTTQLMCVPCFIETAAQMVNAIVNPGDPRVQDAMAQYADIEMSGTTRRRRVRSTGPLDIEAGDGDALDPFELDVDDDDTDA